MAFKQVFTADDKELLASYQKLQRENEKLKSKIGAVGQESKKASQDQSSGLEQTVASLGRAAAGYLSVSAALKLVNSELQRKRELEKESAGAQIDLAGSQQRFLTNLGFVDKKTRTDALAEIEAISKRTGVKANLISAGASDAVSARGPVSIKGALNSVEAAAMVASNAPDQLASLSGGILDVAGMTGLTGDNDAKKNLGFLMGIGSLARVTSLQAISQNLVPGMKGVRGFGDSAQQAGALLATMTTEMADATGATSGTAAISLAEQLEKFLPKLGSTTERMKALQADPKLRDKFLKKASFEKKAVIPVRNLLTAGSPAAKLLEANTAGVLAPEQAEAALDKWLAEVGTVDAQRNAELDRRGEVAIDSINRADRIKGVRGTARERARKAIDLSGQSATSGMLERGLSDLGAMIHPSLETSPAEELGGRIYAMEHTGEGEFSRKRTNIPADEQAVINALKDLKTAIETGLKENTDEVKKGNAKRPQPVPGTHAEQ
jgi:hypothetical protein